jgi:hypothetical protein
MCPILFCLYICAVARSEIKKNKEKRNKTRDSGSNMVVSEAVKIVIIAEDNDTINESNHLDRGEPRYPVNNSTG